MGLAIYKSQKVKFSICGTPGYIAPEILLVDDKESSNTVYTHKCDMFSVGVILYKM
jgi:cell cycle serine/threonine-protein kinase CDC5/MSD2/calcium/calmodulin-dependent protein kinase I